MNYILAIDQGTTGTTAALVDVESFNFVAKSNLEYPQIYPQPGWVEHNLNDIWNSVEHVVRDVLKIANADASDIVAIGITNQRETTCAFNKKGRPLANAIVWQDRRTTERCLDIKNNNKEEFIKKTTGLPCDPYFSATKMEWLLQNNDQVKQAKSRNDLCFGTIDTYLLYQLTGCQVYATEASNASRTLLMNLETTAWDSTLLDFFSLDKSLLPEIRNSFGQFGKTYNLSFLPDGIPITGILGDQQSALFGQAGISKGDMKCTYGTGAFLLMNTEKEIVTSSNGLLTTVAYRQNGETYYALEGSCYIAGAAVQWLRDNLKIIAKSSEVESLALGVKNLKDMDNILFLPFFSGIGSPYWIPEAKAAIVGLTRDSNSSHLARACLDGIALSINDLIMAMASDANLQLSSLKVDGGAVANDTLMLIQATISDLEIIRPKIVETTAFGAAIAAAVGADLAKIQDISKLWKHERSFKPVSEWNNHYQQKKTLWSNTLSKLYR
jgi:glycerol kinase